MSLSLEPLRVLLADDNAHMRHIVRTLFDSFGVKNIRDVRDGSEGLVVLQGWEADVAIVDFKMSPMDGVEFTRCVRNGSPGVSTYLPIIMMTGHSAKARVLAARDAGVTELIAKPVNAKVLYQRVFSVITKPRPFVKTKTYFGPDRRRRSDPAHSGPWRRVADHAAPARDVFEIDDEPPLRHATP